MYKLPNKSLLAIAGKSLAFLLALKSLLPASARADDNPYDLVGKVLVPLANLFVAEPKGPNRALSADLVLEEATGLPPEAAGQVISIQVQSPDKLLVRGIAMGQPLMICRNGQVLWVYPGSKIGALLQSAELSKADPDFRLPPFQLPVNEKQLVFLPVLFQVRDSGEQAVNGVNCRVLDVALMPELAHSIRAEGWIARLWIRPAATLSRFELAHGQWHATVGVKKLVYAPSLAPETWQPDPETAKDVLQLKPSRYKQLLDAASAAFVKYKQPATAPASN